MEEKDKNISNNSETLHNLAYNLRTLADIIQALAETVREDKPGESDVIVTLEQVRAVLAEKSRAGHMEEVRGLLESHGANKLSEINPNEYESLLHEAEAIGNE